MKIYLGGHLTTNNATTAIVIGNKQFSTSSSHSRPLSSNVACALALSFNKRSQTTTGHATRLVVSFLDVRRSSIQIVWRFQINSSSSKARSHGDAFCPAASAPVIQKIALRKKGP